MRTRYDFSIIIGPTLDLTPQFVEPVLVDVAKLFKLDIGRLALHIDNDATVLDRLMEWTDRGQQLAAEVCSLGQITGRLQEVVGRFRPMV